VPTSLLLEHFNCIVVFHFKLQALQHTIRGLVLLNFAQGIIIRNLRQYGWVTNVNVTHCGTLWVMGGGSPSNDSHGQHSYMCGRGNILQPLLYLYTGKHYILSYSYVTPHRCTCYTTLTSDGVASGPRGFPSNINLIVDIWKPCRSQYACISFFSCVFRLILK
jgi:hypothetical protein